MSTTHTSTGGQLALRGGTPIFTSPPAQQYPVFTQQARDRVLDLLDHGPMLGLSKASKVVAAAEEALARFHDVPWALCLNSGHASLHASLIGLEVAQGDEVINSPISWGASVSCILHAGAIPVFADVDPITGLLDPQSILERITPRTRAILVPHIFGQPANMTEICRIAADRGLAVVEDGSQAHGARHAGRRVGSFGDAAGFSCNGVKPVAAGEGGFMLARSDETYFRACISCQHAGGTDFPGRASEQGFPEELRPYVDSLIYSYRMSVLTAAVLPEQLGKLDQENDARNANYAVLKRELDGIGSVSFPTYPDGDECTIHMATMNFVEEHAGIDKATYIAALEAEGVPAFSYVRTPLHRLERLNPETKAPRVAWTDNLRRAGVDPRDVELPNCDRKVATSIELYFNYTTVDEDLMKRIASAFVKVEENLDELRAASTKA
jgi:dTDP-4-amino-4,6-dideoxygalactose transaminase